MNNLRYTLLSDGSSDRALMPHITWLFRQHLIERDVDAVWADPSVFPMGTKGLSLRIKAAIHTYPCDVLCVHRDAERDAHQFRVDEIKRATEKLGQAMAVPHVCVIPVRMTEAWLLFSEKAIRVAAGNPNGKVGLILPQARKIEAIPQPKSKLFELLRIASQKSGHRLDGFQDEQCRSDLVGFLHDAKVDFAPLRALPAFQALEEEIKHVIQANNWNS
jgi:hypothetical protein